MRTPPWRMRRATTRVSGIAIGPAAVVLVGFRDRGLPNGPPHDQEQRHDRDLQHHSEPKEAPEAAHRRDRTRYGRKGCRTRGSLGAVPPSTAPGEVRPALSQKSVRDLPGPESF